MWQKRILRLIGHVSWGTPKKSIVPGKYFHIYERIDYSKTWLYIWFIIRDWQRKTKSWHSRFCEDNSPDVTVNGRTLNVLFRSNKRSKGGEGAECTASCIDTEEASTTPASTEAPTTTPSPATTAAPTTGLSHNGKEWIPRLLFHHYLSLPYLSTFSFQKWNSEHETVSLAICTPRKQITEGVGKLVSGRYDANATLKKFNFRAGHIVSFRSSFQYEISQ